MANEQTEPEVAEDAVTPDEDVETPKGEDEPTPEATADDATPADPEAQDEPDGDKPDGDEEPEDKTDEDSTFTKRYTQFKGDSPEEYAKNLEEAYHNSSAEAVRLSREVKEMKTRLDTIAGQVANNPELAEKLNQTPASDAIASPAVAWAEEKLNEEIKKDYADFVDLHPEIETDPTLGEKMEKAISSVIQVTYDTENRRAPLREAMEKAWIILGKDKEDNQEKLDMAVKDQASMNKTTPATAKPKPKSEFTPAQLEMAKKLGLTEEQLRENVKNN